MMNIALVGFGNVGQGFTHILQHKADALRREYGFEARLVAVVTGSRGSLYHPDGLALGALIEAAGRGSLDHYPDAPGLQRGWDALRIVNQPGVDALVEASPSNLRSGQPALDVCRAALKAGRHVVLANKGPVAVAYAELVELAAQAGVLLRFEGTVMAGTPSLRLAQQALAGCRISAARGILNGTTNFILTRMESGLAYEAALAEAQALGYAEADPSADVDGWDAAGKAVILAAALFGQQLTLDDMAVTGISGISSDAVRAAQSAGRRWKLIASVTSEGARVEPVSLLVTDPLAGVSGATNAITYTTDLLGDVTLIGAGAGRQETGFALLADLLDIHFVESDRQNRKHL